MAAPVHPFPARMAPEIARRSLETLCESGRVIDPMCGSGTVLRAAVERGRDCSGVDIDPLAVLMSRVWTTRIQPFRLLHDAQELVRLAKSLSTAKVNRPTDIETQAFIAYWFADRQAEDLARLATVLKAVNWTTKDALAVSLSRIIVSKEMMASLARDTSHSRPHKVSEENRFEVYSGFLKSVRFVAGRLNPELIRATAAVLLGDARTLEDIPDRAFDLALTSPPYLNAIDYLRGHRLTLVWLGYDVASIRDIRSASVGTERLLSRKESCWSVDPYIYELKGSTITDRHRGWVRRYATDMRRVLEQLGRVVRSGGHVVMVIGNSFVRGSIIDNASMIEALAAEVGLEPIGRTTREIPARRRYLPPPGDGENTLDARMRTEVVLSLKVC
jgi:DNA modification methylase